MRRTESYYYYYRAIYIIYILIITNKMANATYCLYYLYCVVVVIRRSGDHPFFFFLHSSFVPLFFSINVPIKKRNSASSCHLSYILLPHITHTYTILIIPLSITNPSIIYCIVLHLLFFFKKKLYTPRNLSSLHGLCCFIVFYKSF